MTRKNVIVKYMKLQTQKTAKKMQNQSMKKKNSNIDETKLVGTKNISSRNNMKLPRLWNFG